MPGRPGLSDPDAGRAGISGGPSESTVRLRPNLSVRAIAPDVLLHESTRDLPGLGPIGSNGLVVLGSSEALLVDTAWGDEPTAVVLDWVERETGRRVTDLVVTHAHDDRIGGIREAQRRGIRVHELDLTARRAAADGWPPPDRVFSRATVLLVDGQRAEVFHLGAAHSPDNVVVWLPRQRILFGSCMIRSADATDVGNRADASLSTWERSVEAVETRWPTPVLVVPGHGKPGGPELLANTKEVVRRAVDRGP
ncbi:MAG: subclass B1 metallo-beta-lactamase [Alphaproteobacteria bacterium]